MKRADERQEDRRSTKESRRVSRIRLLKYSDQFHFFLLPCFLRLLRAGLKQGSVRVCLSLLWLVRSEGWKRSSRWREETAKGKHRSMASKVLCGFPVGPWMTGKKQRDLASVLCNMEMNRGLEQKRKVWEGCITSLKKVNFCSMHSEEC